MKRLFIGMVALFLAFGTVAACTQPAEAAITAPLLNVYEHNNYGGRIIAQFQATNCGTTGASSRQEFQIGWPARLQGSSFLAITSAPYCNVFGVHSYSGYWYQACTMSRRIYYGNYGMSWLGSSQADGWFNDNTDYVMIGYYSGCPLNS